MGGFGPPKAGFSHQPDVVMLPLWSTRPRRKACLAGRREKPVKWVKTYFLWYYLTSARPRVVGYLPPYLPDFNPIEMAFSKLKALLRKAAARTITELWEVIADGIEQFTRQECTNFFAAAGYDLK